MSLSNFTPVVWSASIMKALEKAHVYASVANRSYEGEIRNAGDTVKINQLADVTIKTYTKNTDIAAPDNLTAAQTELKIDQSKYFNFQVDDIDKAQNNVAVLDEAGRKSGYGLRDVVDQFFAAMYASAGLSGVGTNASPVAVNSANIEDTILLAGEVMNSGNLPLEGRFMIAPPWWFSKLVLAGLVTKTSNDDMWTNGLVGKVLGFDQLMSNNVSKNSTSWDKTRIICGIRGQSLAYAEQILEVEGYRPQLRFGDALKGLHVYGGKVIRPDMTLTVYADKTAEA